MSSENLRPHRYCSQCGTKFFKKINVSNTEWRERARFCSKICANTFRRGLEMSQEEREKRKGQIAWNKGLKGVQVAWNKGKSFPQVLSEKNGLWKGNNATMEAQHAWIVRRLGKPKKCEHCGTTEDKMYHWANLSGKYHRDVTDYIRLCVPCHKRMDLQRIYKTKKK